jgi:tight adherence protein B
MNYIYIGILLFVTSIIIVELLKYAYRNIDAVKRSVIRKRIRKHIFVTDPTDDVEIVKQRVMSEIPVLNKILLVIPFIEPLERLIVQANSGYSVGFFILLSLILAIGGFWSILTFLHNQFFGLIVALVGAGIPYVYLSVLKRKRLLKFQAQLPDGMDLIARALKAGHALTSAMKIVSDEFGDPLATEFDEVLGEVNFGASLASALKNLADRVDCAEVKYFVIAVTLQRETGGNLAELLEKLAELMRRNFEFQGKVRTLSAESRFSAVILSILPFLLAMFIHLRSPNYLGFLIQHPMGKTLIAICGGMMFIGIIVLNRLVNIKV